MHTLEQTLSAWLETASLPREQSPQVCPNLGHGVCSSSGPYCCPMQQLCELSDGVAQPCSIMRGCYLLCVHRRVLSLSSWAAARLERLQQVRQAWGAQASVCLLHVQPQPASQTDGVAASRRWACNGTHPSCTACRHETRQPRLWAGDPQLFSGSNFRVPAWSACMASCGLPKCSNVCHSSPAACSARRPAEACRISIKPRPASHCCHHRSPINQQGAKTRIGRPSRSAGGGCCARRGTSAAAAGALTPQHPPSAAAC